MIFRFSLDSCEKRGRYRKVGRGGIFLDCLVAKDIHNFEQTYAHTYANDGSTRVERMEGTCARKSVFTCLRATFVKESRSCDGRRRGRERGRERERLQKFSNRRRKAREIKLEKCRGALRIDERTKLAIILIHLVLSKFFQIIIFNYFLLTFKF